MVFKITAGPAHPRYVYGVTEACRGMHMEHTNKILQHNAWNIQYVYMCVSIYICMDVVYLCMYVINMCTYDCLDLYCYAYV